MRHHWSHSLYIIVVIEGGHMDDAIRQRKDILIGRILALHFQTGRRVRARSELEYLFLHCYSRRIAYMEGPLRQALVLSYLEPSVDEESPTARPTAILYLELRNGMVYGMSATGNTDRALENMERIGAGLTEQPWDAECLPVLEQQLDQLINAESLSDCPCTIRLFRHAPMVPDQVMAADIIGTSCRRVFDTIHAACGYAGNSFDSDEILPYFESQYLPAAESITQFRSALEPSAMQMVNQMCSRYTRKAAQLQVYNFFASGNAIVRRNRMQAIEVLPWLAPLLSGLNLRNWKMARIAEPAYADIREDMAEPLKQILDAVDTGKPLFDAVAAAFGIPRETVRWSRHRVLPDVDYFDCFQVDFLLIALSWMPAEKRPVTPMEWLQFGEFVFDCIETLARFNLVYTPDCVGTSPGRYSLHLVRLQPFSAILSRWLHESLGTGITSMAMRLKRNCQGHTGMQEATDFLLCLRMSFHHACPAVDYDEIVEDPFNDYMVAWFETINLRHLLNISKAWHRVIVSPVDRNGLPASETLERQDEGRLNCWPALLGKPFRYRDWEAVELTSSPDLIEEGNMLKHCIGGYTDHCLFGSTLIYSIREVSGLRLSTVALHVKHDPCQVTVIAHYARRNAQPDSDSEAAVDALVQALKQPAHAGRLQSRIADWKSACAELTSMDMHMLRSLHSNIYNRRIEQLAWECAFPSAPAPWTEKSWIA